MALVFNSITQFVIQPERTKKRVKRDDLDTLTEIWTGPSAQEDTFVPPIGTAHHDFSLMTVISTSAKRLPMYVSEVTIEYHGKLDNYGAAQYTSVPSIDQYWAEGEVAMGSGGTTISRRYTGRCVQIDYLTNRRPSGNPTNIGLANGFLGFTNVWDQVTSFGPSPVTIAPPIEKLSCTDVKVDDKADGWYRVTETYQSRMYPGESITGAGGPPKPAEKQGPMTIYGPFPLFGGADWYGSLNTVGQSQTLRATGATQAVAAGAGGTVQTTTVPTSNAANTAQQAGIDPGSHYVVDPGSVASEFSPALDTPPALAASDAAGSSGFDWMSALGQSTTLLY